MAADSVRGGTPHVAASGDRRARSRLGGTLWLRREGASLLDGETRNQRVIHGSPPSTSRENALDEDSKKRVRRIGGRQRGVGPATCERTKQGRRCNRWHDDAALCPVEGSATAGASRTTPKRGSPSAAQARDVAAISWSTPSRSLATRITRAFGRVRANSAHKTASVSGENAPPGSSTDEGVGCSRATTYLELDELEVNRAAFETCCQVRRERSLKGVAHQFGFHVKR